MEKIRHSYTADYISIWNSTLADLDVVQFRSVDDASRVFSEINGPANPFGRLLDLVKPESGIYEAAPTQTNDE